MPSAAVQTNSMQTSAPCADRCRAPWEGRAPPCFPTSTKSLIHHPEDRLILFCLPENGLELLISLPAPSKWQDSRRAPLCPDLAISEVENQHVLHGTQALCQLRPVLQSQDDSLGEGDMLNAFTAGFHPWDDYNSSNTEMSKGSSQI